MPNARFIYTGKSVHFNAGETAVDDTIEKAGHEPNGYFWEGVARFILQGHTLEEKLEFDPEAGMFVAIGAKKDLEQFVALLQPYTQDAKAIKQLIAKAKQADFEFDD